MIGYDWSRESLKQKVLKYLSNVEKEKEYSTYGKYMIGVESDLVFFTLAFFFFQTKEYSTYGKYMCVLHNILILIDIVLVV